MRPLFNEASACSIKSVPLTPDAMSKSGRINLDFSIITLFSILIPIILCYSRYFLQHGITIYAIVFLSSAFLRSRPFLFSHLSGIPSWSVSVGAGVLFSSGHPPTSICESIIPHFFDVSAYCFFLLVCPPS